MDTTRREFLRDLSRRKLRLRQSRGEKVYVGSQELRSARSSYRFEAGRCVAPATAGRLIGMELVGFLVGNRVFDEWREGARALLFREDGRDGEVAMTSSTVSFKTVADMFAFDTRPTTLSVPEELPPSMLRTDAAIPTAKMLREIAKKKVEPPRYASPDQGSNTRIDLSTLQALLNRSAS